MKQYLCTIQLVAQLTAGTKTKRTGQAVLTLTSEQATNPNLIPRELINRPEHLYRAIPRWILGKTREAYKAEKVTFVQLPALGLKEVENFKINYNKS
jgi:hypothetical protein